MLSVQQRRAGKLPGKDQCRRLMMVRRKHIYAMLRYYARKRGCNWTAIAILTGADRLSQQRFVMSLLLSAVVGTKGHAGDGYPKQGDRKYDSQ